MKFSLFNIYIILLVIWFVYNFIKKRKAMIEKQKKAREEYQRSEGSNESEDDVLRKLKNMVDWNSKDNSESEEKKLIRDILGDSRYEDDDDYEDEEDEYKETSSTTSAEPVYKREVENNSRSRIDAEQKAILEKQRIFEEYAKKSSINDVNIRSRTSDKTAYDYDINKRKAVSIFKASSEDLRNAIIYKAILERRGNKIR